MSRPLKPVESFGPEILAALVQGATRKIEMLVPYRKAVHFRQRANALRASMRNTNHPLSGSVSQTSITIDWKHGIAEEKSSRGVRRPRDPNAEVRLTIAPSDSEFNEALTRAGVSIMPPTPATTELPAVGDDVLQQYVKNSVP